MFCVVGAAFLLIAVKGEDVNLNILSYKYLTGLTCNSLAHEPLTHAPGKTSRSKFSDHVCYFHPEFNEICEQYRTKLHKSLAVPADELYEKMILYCSSEIVSTPPDELWECVINKYHLCDGTSQCLTDECGCEDVDVFYCIDNSGCIAFVNVCDGVQNCRDGSDERMCSDVIQCMFKNQQYSSPRSVYCLKRDTAFTQCIPSDPIDCSPWPETLAKDSPLTQCLSEFFSNAVLRDENEGFSLEKYKAWCKTSCDPQWIHFCTHLNDPRVNGFTMICFDESTVDDVNNQISQVSIYKVCDGQNNCRGNTDEANCSGRFYCAGENHRWIKTSQVCDNNKDCPEGEDECQACSGVSSDRELVKHKGLYVYMIVVAVLIILFNIFAGVEIFCRDYATTSGKVDKIILFTVCFYDTLMGLYLAFVFTKSTIFSGSYCVNDGSWRRSIQCKLLGCLFTLSVHGSLAMVSLMSLTRCCKCVFERTVGVKTILLITGSAFIILAILSALPILAVSDLQDIFRASMMFKDNPFITKYTSTDLSRIYNVYKGNDTSCNPDTYTMLNQLNNISSKPGIFDPIELGFYSFSSLCIQRIYGIQESLVWYKVIYTSCILLLLAAVSVSYILIVIYALNSSRAVQNGANIQPPNNDKDLGVKVMLMIGSQLFCWLTVTTLIVINGLSETSRPTDLVYELTAIVFLPLNSLLNPIFYSSLYKLGLVWIKQRLAKLWDSGVTN